MTNRSKKKNIKLNELLILLLTLFVLYTNAFGFSSDTLYMIILAIVVFRIFNTPITPKIIQNEKKYILKNVVFSIMKKQKVTIQLKSLENGEDLLNYLQIRELIIGAGAINKRIRGSLEKLLVTNNLTLQQKINEIYINSTISGNKFF